MGSVVDFPTNTGSVGKPGGANRYLAVLTIELRQDSLEDAVGCADLCRRFAYEATNRISVPRVTVAGVVPEPASDFPEVAFAVSTLSGVNVSVLSPLHPAQAIGEFLRWAKSLDPETSTGSAPLSISLSVAPSETAAAAQFAEAELFTTDGIEYPAVPVNALLAAIKWFRASGYRDAGINRDARLAIEAAIEAASVDVVAELASVPALPEES